MRIRLVQLDGSLPNLALMNLYAWAKRNRYEVSLSQHIEEWPDREFDEVWGSSIFKFSLKARALFEARWPDSVMGGTGTDDPITVEQLIAPDACDEYCYDGYPNFKESIGFTQRGCRLSCKFCVVPGKEGKPKSVRTIYDIWRGDPYPKKLHLLDNDFFGQPEWRERIREIREGGFRVCLSQGINIRMITEESATALASIQYRDTKFKERKLYTAWDNYGDADRFFKGVSLLNQAGIPSKHIRAYMLVGYDPAETWEKVWDRFLQMTAVGIEPYPMVFDKARTDLVSMQRWACRGLYRIIKWPDYVRRTKSAESVEAYYKVVEQSL